MDKNITIVLGVRNRISTGLAEAASKFAGIGKTMGRIWEAAWRPAAVMFSAYAAITKVVKLVGDAMNAQANAQAKITRGNLDAYVARVTRELREEAEAHKDVVTAIERESRARETRVKWIRETADARERESRARAKTGMDETGQRGIDAASARYNAMLEAARKVEDAEAEIAEARKNSGATSKALADVDERMADAIERYREGALAVEQARKRAASYWGYAGALKSMVYPGGEEKATANLAEAQKALSDEFALIESLRQRRKELLDEAAKNADREIELTEKRAAALANVAAVEIESANELAEAEKAALEARTKQMSEMTDERRKQMDELTKMLEQAEARQTEIITDAERERLREVKDAAEERVKELQDAAKKSVKARIEEARQARQQAEKRKREEDKENARGELYERRLRTGGGLSKKQQEWLDEWRKKQMQRREAFLLGGEIQAAGEKLAQLDPAVTELQRLRRDIAENSRRLEQLSIAR